jgi:micrococcal nuclease
MIPFMPKRFNFGTAKLLAGAAAVGGLAGYALSGGSTPSINSHISSPSVYYRYCSDARAAGAAPIHRGEPGYRSELDADNDGVACEPYRR